MDIRTVLGTLAPGNVGGPVLPHEHLHVDLRTPTDSRGYLDHGDSVTDELRALADEQGLSLIVDQTCRGMGRNFGKLADISRRSGVPIVGSTGWYYENFHPTGEPPAVEEATQLLIQDIEEGEEVPGVGRVRAGLIGEVGSHGEDLTDAERRAFEAAAQASLATGVAISTHAHLGRGAAAQLEILLGAGVPPERICVGHQDLLAETSDILTSARTGVYVALDTAGKSSYQSDEHRLDHLMGLLEAGHGERVLVSNDISRHAYLSTDGGWGYAHALTTFAEGARRRGVDKQTWDMLTRQNPVRWLTGGDIS